MKSNEPLNKFGLIYTSDRDIVKIIDWLSYILK